MKAQVLIRLKKGLLDPQGKAVQGALHTMGYEGMKGVRVGKLIELEVADQSKEKAMEELNTICQKLLSNPIIEDFEVTLADG